MDEIDIQHHTLVPEHVKLSEEKKKKLLDDLNISVKQLPRIFSSDPGIKNLDVKSGDVILIKRKSFTAKETNYYRVVISG